METLSERDAAALLDVVAQLDRLDDPLPFPPRLMRLVAGLLRTGDANYCELDRRNRRVVVASGWNEGVDELIVDDPGDEHEWDLLTGHPVCSRRLLSGDWTTPHTISEYVTLRELRRLPLWNEVYREARINYWLDVGLPVHRGHTRVFISVHETRDFGDRERLLLRLLEPHLEKRARDVAIAAAAVEALASAEEAGDGARDVVLATARGTIEFASARSRALLAAYFGAGNGRLPDALLTDGPVVVRRAGKRLTVRTARVDGLRVLLLGEDDDRVERLTSRQREILGCVAAGLTDAQIGERLGIAAATVNKHLEAIYDRLEVHTRTAAAALHRG